MHSLPDRFLFFRDVWENFCFVVPFIFVLAHFGEARIIFVEEFLVFDFPGAKFFFLKFHFIKWSKILKNITRRKWDNEKFKQNQESSELLPHKRMVFLPCYHAIILSMRWSTWNWERYFFFKVSTCFQSSRDWSSLTSMRSRAGFSMIEINILNQI